MLDDTETDIAGVLFVVARRGGPWGNKRRMLCLPTGTY